MEEDRRHQTAQDLLALPRAGFAAGQYEALAGEGFCEFRFPLLCGAGEDCSPRVRHQAAAGRIYMANSAGVYAGTFGGWGRKLMMFYGE